MSTVRTLIHVHKEKLTMRFNDQEVTFNVSDILKFPEDVENCSAIESLGLDYCQEEVIVEIFG